MCGMPRVVAGGQVVQAAFPRTATSTAPGPHTLLQHDDVSSILSFACNPEDLPSGQNQGIEASPSSEGTLTWKSRMT